MGLSDGLEQTIAFRKSLFTCCFWWSDVVLVRVRHEIPKTPKVSPIRRRKRRFVNAWLLKKSFRQWRGCKWYRARDLFWGQYNLLRLQASPDSTPNLLLMPVTLFLFFFIFRFFFNRFRFRDSGWFVTLDELLSLIIECEWKKKLSVFSVLG